MWVGLINRSCHSREISPWAAEGKGKKDIPCNTA